MTKEEELTAWKFRRHLRLKKKTAAFEALHLCLRFYPWRCTPAWKKRVGEQTSDRGITWTNVGKLVTR